MIYTLSHTINHAAQKWPDKIAFTDGRKEITFTKLHDRVNQLANQLRELGVERGDRVGLYLNRCLDTPVALHAVMKIGAIYVPMDTKSPAHLTRFLIEDCGIKILISNKSQKRNLANLLAETKQIECVIGLEVEWTTATISWETVFEKSVAFNPPHPILEQDPAYIIYTSGSTGTPKGIVHSHASGLAYAKLKTALYEINDQDVIANHAPVFFDVSLIGYFVGPLTGAKTLIIPDAHTVMPASMSQLIEKAKITIWYSVPLALIQMLEHGELEQKDFSDLRWVFYAGEAFPPKYLSQLMAVWSHARFSNIYGPAETNQCTFYNIPEAPIGDEPIPIGQIWGNTEMLIVDEEMQEVEKGEVGELLIRSATTMLGYWNRPERNRICFYKLKNQTGFDKVFYKTGDLVIEDETGILHLRGRRDHQIKTRGYRVELGAVESALVALDEIAEAAVFPFKNDDETISIAAAIILKNEQNANEADLKHKLKSELPFYAIPERIEILQQFPRTGSGKINRPVLKESLMNL